MAGNVGEWVNDWYDANYYGSLPEPVIDPQGPGPGPNGSVSLGPCGSGSWFHGLVGGPGGVPLEIIPPDLLERPLTASVASAPIDAEGMGSWTACKAGVDFI